ncbi:MAG: outer membrane protein assembly factor BamC [Candidatus Thiodiazotropha sp.]|jgi:outer membrane protein assembly factor BamC
MRLSPIFLSLLLLILPLFGCSSDGGYFSTSDRMYRTQKETVDDLDVPPDLTSSTMQDALMIPGSGSASYEDYAHQREKSTGTIVAEQVLPEFDTIRVNRNGDQRWLVIQAQPESVWPKVVAFWRTNGLLLVEQNPTIGIMKTDWLESRADIKQGPITEFLRKALEGIYTSATRDQFRVRLERGEEPGTTEIYLTHRGLEEKLKEDVSGDADTTYWTPRPNDPGIEVAMLRSLMVYLGASQEKAEAAITAPDNREDHSWLVKNGERSELMVNEDFPHAWRLTGVALDRVGFAVEDRDRTSGIYYVRYNELQKNDDEDKGFFSKLAFWRDDEVEIDYKAQYRVKLKTEDEGTLITVQDEKGGPAAAEVTERILGLIHEQIR